MNKSKNNNSNDDILNNNITMDELRWRDDLEWMYATKWINLPHDRTLWRQMVMMMMMNITVILPKRKLRQK